VLATFDRILQPDHGRWWHSRSASPWRCVDYDVMLIAVAQRVKEIGCLKALERTEADTHYLLAERPCFPALQFSGAAVGLRGSIVIGQYIRHCGSARLGGQCWRLGTLGDRRLFQRVPARRAAKLDAVAALAGR